MIHGFIVQPLEQCRSPLPLFSECHHVGTAPSVDKDWLDFDSVHTHQCTDLLCSSSTVNLLSTYERYLPLWDCNKRHVVAGVSSQLKPAGWREMLLDSEIVDEDSHFILDGIMHGFKIVDPYVNIAGYETENYSSATVKAVDFMDNLLKEELDSGKL